MSEDPYKSMTKECQINIYEEQKLRKCGFASKYVEEEIFHTPPEQHHSFDDPGPDIRPGSHQAGRKSDGGDCDGDVVCDDDVSKDEVELKKESKVESQFTSQNDCLGENEPIVIEIDDIDIAETEVVDLSDEENCDKLGERAEKCGTSRERLGLKSVEDVDAFTYVSSGSGGARRGVSTRRALPNSFKEHKENEGLWVPRRSFRDIETFKGLEDAAGIIGGDGTNIDYIKAAKELGLIFHQPRWWPREGFDDHAMD